MVFSGASPAAPRWPILSGGHASGAGRRSRTRFRMGDSAFTSAHMATARKCCEGGFPLRVGPAQFTRENIRHGGGDSRSVHAASPSKPERRTIKSSTFIAISCRMANWTLALSSGGFPPTGGKRGVLANRTQYLDPSAAVGPNDPLGRGRRHAEILRGLGRPSTKSSNGPVFPPGREVVRLAWAEAIETPICEAMRSTSFSPSAGGGQFSTANGDEVLDLGLLVKSIFASVGGRAPAGLIARAAHGLTYHSSSAYAGSTDTLHASVDDQGNTGSGGPQSASGTSPISLTRHTRSPTARA